MSADGTIRIESADIVWTKDEFEMASQVSVDIMPNGWIYTPETRCYYPPSQVEEIMRREDSA